MKSKAKLSRYIQLWGTVLIIGLASCITAISILQSFRDFNMRSSQLRDHYIADQKEIVKEEVMRVASLIAFEKLQGEKQARQRIKNRTDEAYAVARNIYDQNRSDRSEEEIRKMILDALRPLRHEKGKGYYFAIRMDGLNLLCADHPEWEGTNLLNSPEAGCQHAVRDMIDLTKASKEGFLEYPWTKPRADGNGFRKVSYIKLFEPYQWVIGTGLYADDIEKRIQSDLLAIISRIRFGKEGYIFINRLNGDALVSNGKLFSGTRKLWEEFDADPGKMKKVFQDEYEAALKPGGDYIYYSHVKLTAPEKESPKASFILGFPEWEWIIGAGVYLDDVEQVIALMQADLVKEIKHKFLLSLMASLAVFIVFLVLFNRFNRHLKDDTNTLVSFLRKAGFSNEPVDRDRIFFDELDQMAATANRMLTEKDEAEQALAKSEKRFKDLAENSSDLVWEFDENEIFTYVSPRVKDLMGYEPEELIGHPAFEGMSPEEKEKTMNEFLVHKNSREPFSNKIHVNPHKDGHTVILESSGIPIIDSQGIYHGYRGIDRDITERISYEEQIRQAHKMEAVGTLAGGIAHDFNNILSAIMGYAELAKLEIPPSFPAAQFIDEILKASNRARELVRHILSFSRKEPGQLAPIQINLIVNEVVKLIRATTPTNIEIQTEIDPDCGQVLANPTQLHQVILNLCTNAAQAMDGRSGILGIHLHPIEIAHAHRITIPERVKLNPGSYAKLTVRDTGPGIDPDVLGRIFDPYFTTKDIGKGSGMGLAVVKGIVKSFDGTLEVESSVDIGSSFHVYFPLLEADRSQQSQDKEEPPAEAKGNERILLVDDEEDLVAVNRRRLEMLGYQVTVCTQSDDALIRVRSQPAAFDLVVTDQSMPKMTGEQLAAELLAIRPDLPIIMCTGYSSQIDEKKAAGLGIKTFLMKPVGGDELAQAIRKVLNKSRPDPGS